MVALLIAAIGRPPCDMREGERDPRYHPRPSSCIMPCCSALTPLAILRGICTDHNNWPTLVCRTETAPPALQRERERERERKGLRTCAWIRQLSREKELWQPECARAQRLSSWMTACCSTPTPLAYYVTSAPISTENGFTSVNIVSWSKA
jgi:hypothetical protein